MSFISNLGTSLTDFLEYKRALGIKYTTAERYLCKLDAYNYAHGNEHTLVKTIVDGWVIEHAEKVSTPDKSWLSPIREFGRYLVNVGDTTAYVLDDTFTIQKYRPDVYLMTEAEIQSFFEECDKYVLQYNAPGRAYVFPALYRFMYCCGVRSVEARQLKCSEVCLDKGYVDILWAKGHRDRRLYLSDELTDYLVSYNTAITAVFPEREYFFPSTHGGICSSTALAVNFKNIWLSAGLKRDGKIKPRAYDFRHHFACANIMRWSSEGKDVHAMLPYLMRYMGHSSLESTYYYIHLIPDYFPQYKALTATTEDLIPEVDDNEI